MDLPGQTKVSKSLVQFLSVLRNQIGGTFIFVDNSGFTTHCIAEHLAGFSVTALLSFN